MYLDPSRGIGRECRDLVRNHSRGFGLGDRRRDQSGDGPGGCWSTTPNPTTADHPVPAGTGTGAFTAQLTGLAIGQVRRQTPGQAV
ncbi:MAG: hypothetical protein CSA22_10540 [Deltaproteobacteria bacterium]|nr:MAG: hypothetical protein CSA22_10540 [Deltaproteobacteria bacterium]